MRIAMAMLVMLVMYAICITVLLVTEPAKQEPVCIPLYSETGLECCE